LPHPARSDHRVLTLSPAYSLRATADPKTDSRSGFRPSELYSLRPASPVTGFVPSCRCRSSLPSPLRMRRSRSSTRLHGVTPIEEPHPSRPSEDGLAGPLLSWTSFALRSSPPPRWPWLPRSFPPVLHSPRPSAEATRHGAGTPGPHSMAESGSLSRELPAPRGFVASTVSRPLR
jgi:hypothetical protein